MTNLEPRLDIAESFLAALDRNARFTFQTFDDTASKRKNLANILHGTIAQHFDTLRQLNDAGAGIFVTVNRTDLKGRKASNIVAVRGIFADFDNGTDGVKGFPLRPNIAVGTSPGNLHLYWFADDIPVDAFTPTQKALINRVRSDASVHDLPRVMRLPGFFHRKSNPHLVTSKVLRTERYTFAELDRILQSGTLLPNITPPSATPLHMSKAAQLASLAATNSLQNPTKGRHSLAVQLGWQCRKENLSEEAALYGAVTFAQLARKTDSDGHTKPLVEADAVSAVQNAYRSGKQPVGMPTQGDLAPISASDLLKRTFPPITWIVPAILPAGLTLLAGKPKTGKSWLALDIAYAVATGTTSLTSTPARPGEALYLALEDNERRLQSRLNTLRLDRLDTSSPKRLFLETNCPRLDQGAVEHIRKWLHAHNDAKLVIVDTLAKLRAQRGSNSDMYGGDYAASSALKALADEFGISVLVVAHNRKAESDDPMDLISGTLGLAGGADGVMILRRKRGDKNAALFVTGRDIEDEKDYGIEFKGCRWHVVGDARSVMLSAERQAVIDLLKKTINPLTVAEISAGTGGSGDATRKLVYRMLQAGDLTQSSNRKLYSLPSSPTRPSVKASPTGQKPLLPPGTNGTGYTPPTQAKALTTTSEVLP